MIERGLSVVVDQGAVPPAVDRTSFFYHEPVGETEQNLGLMRLIDKQYFASPFYEVRRMT